MSNVRCAGHPQNQLSSSSPLRPAGADAGLRIARMQCVLSDKWMRHGRERSSRAVVAPSKGGHRGPGNKTHRVAHRQLGWMEGGRSLSGIGCQQQEGAESPCEMVWRLWSERMGQLREGSEGQGNLLGK